MEDFLGNELAVGNNVIYMSRDYIEFRKGIISRFTNTQVVITDDNGGVRRTYPQNIVKISKENGNYEVCSNS